MNWTEVKIYTTTAGIDPLTGSMLDLGLQGFMIEDAQDFDEFLHDTTPHWDYVDQAVMEKMKDCETCVTIYVADNPQGMEELMQVRQILARLKAQDPDGKYGRLELEMKDVDEEDWSNAWKKYYHPVQVGEHLVVCPSWEAYDRKPDEVVLTLNPGMAFGTGTHDTTRLCMELLEKYITPQDTVLDVGCGSGILAITAALLGANKIIGCDIDEVAVKVAGENAALNGVQDRHRLPSGRPDQPGGGQLPDHLRQHRGRRHHPPERGRGPLPCKGRHLYYLRHHRHPRTGRAECTGTKRLPGDRAPHLRRMGRIGLQGKGAVGGRYAQIFYTGHH